MHPRVCVCVCVPKLLKNCFCYQILTTTYNKNRDEALKALVTLGFPKVSAEKALEKAIKQQGMLTENVELLIKAALKNF